MNQQQGKQFVADVLSQVWQFYDADKINDFYHTDIQGIVNGQDIDIEDIRRQAEFCKLNYTKTDSTILNIATNDNVILANVRQTNHAIEGDNTEFQFMVEYQLRDGKVANINVVTHPNFDYKLKC